MISKCYGLEIRWKNSRGVEQVLRKSILSKIESGAESKARIKELKKEERQ